MKQFWGLTVFVCALGMAISHVETTTTAYRIRSRRQFGALRPSLGGDANYNPYNNGNNGGFGDPNYQPVYSQGGGGSPSPNMPNPTSPNPDQGNNGQPPFNPRPGNNNQPPLNPNTGTTSPPSRPFNPPNAGNNGGNMQPSYNGGNGQPSYNNGGNNDPSYNNMGNNVPSYNNNGGDNTPIISIPYNPDVDFDIRPLIIEIFRPFNYDRFFNTNSFGNNGNRQPSSYPSNNNQGGSPSYFGGNGYNTGVGGGLNQGNRGTGGVVGYGRKVGYQAMEYFPMIDFDNEGSYMDIPEFSIVVW